MGFNKCYVQPLDVVKQQFEELGLEKFKELYRRRDAFIGPEDAVDFILEKLQQKNSESAVKKVLSHLRVDDDISFSLDSLSADIQDISDDPIEPDVKAVD